MWRPWHSRDRRGSTGRVPTCPQACPTARHVPEGAQRRCCHAPIPHAALREGGPGSPGSAVDGWAPGPGAQDAQDAQDAQAVMRRRVLRRRGRWLSDAEQVPGSARFDYGFIPPWLFALVANDLAEFLISNPRFVYGRTGWETHRACNRFRPLMFHKTNSAPNTCKRGTLYLEVQHPFPLRCSAAGNIHGVQQLWAHRDVSVGHCPWLETGGWSPRKSPFARAGAVRRSTAKP